MKEFDKKAATWDEDPMKVERSQLIAIQIKEYFDGRQFVDGLEYGSGTGLLGFEFVDACDHLTLMDESSEMIRLANEKAKAYPDGKVEAIQYDLLKDPLPKKRFDIIFTLLTMHHIHDTSSILNKFNKILKPGGVLVIIDLEKEDGTFHVGNFDGHLGFEREDIETQLNEHALNPIAYKTVYTIVKRKGEEGERGYPLFMSVSEKVG